MTDLNEPIVKGSRVKIDRLGLKGSVLNITNEGKFMVEFFDHESRIRIQRFEERELTKIKWR